MVRRSEFPSIEAAVGVLPHDVSWVEGTNRDAPTDVRDYIATARNVVERHADVLPFSPDIVTVVAATGMGPYRVACCAPVRCGTFTKDGEQWWCEKQPEEYVIFFNHDVATDNSIESLRGAIRHELAHAASFHENEMSLEGEGAHGRWLDRLDAPRSE